MRPNIFNPRLNEFRPNSPVICNTLIYFFFCWFFKAFIFKYEKTAKQKSILVLINLLLIKHLSQKTILSLKNHVSNKNFLVLRLLFIARLENPYRKRQLHFRRFYYRSIATCPSTRFKSHYTPELITQQDQNRNKSPASAGIPAYLTDITFAGSFCLFELCVWNYIYSALFCWRRFWKKLQINKARWITGKRNAI